jgi:hypothetical protein
VVQAHNESAIRIHGEGQSLNDGAAGIGAGNADAATNGVVAGRKFLKCAIHSPDGVEEDLELAEDGGEQGGAGGNMVRTDIDSVELDGKAGGTSVRGKFVGCLVEIDADPENECLPGLLHEDATDLASADKHIVGPLEAGNQAGTQGPNGADRGHSGSGGQEACRGDTGLIEKDAEQQRLAGGSLPTTAMATAAGGLVARNGEDTMAHGSARRGAGDQAGQKVAGGIEFGSIVDGRDQTHRGQGAGVVVAIGLDWGGCGQVVSTD